MSAVSSFKEYFAYVQTLLLKTGTDEQLFEAIVNAPFCDKLHTTSIDLGMIVFVLANRQTQQIERVAYSKTQPAIDAVKASPKEFLKIKLPLNDKENITAKAIRNGKYYKTSDWQYLLSPALSPEAARFNQAEAGMGCSFVYPLKGAREGGALIFSFYQNIDMIGKKHLSFMKRYSDFVASRLGAN